MKTSLLQIFYYSVINRSNPYCRTLVKLTLVATILLGLAAVSPAKAQVTSHRGQAVFIYHFIKYINWQASADKLTLGVLGRSEIMTELSKINGKIINGKEIEIKQISSVAEASNCQIVYVPESRSRSISDLTPLLEEKGVLLVSEVDLVEKGASISFLILENKLKFKVNASSIKLAKLQISNDLLSIAVAN